MDFNVILNVPTPAVVELATAEDYDLIRDFELFVKSLRNCIGLAANQVSICDQRIMKRFFVFYSNGWIPVLNPKITEYYGDPIPKQEGCKTWPGQIIVASRYQRISVEYQDSAMKWVKKDLVSADAQVFQHEIDHLNGVTENFSSKLIPQNPIGRNNPCPCNSGKKYKNCCLRTDLW